MAKHFSKVNGDVRSQEGQAKRMWKPAGRFTQDICNILDKAWRPSLHKVGLTLYAWTQLSKSWLWMAKAYFKALYPT